MNKLMFVSPEWIDEARRALEDLVAEHGEDGTGFSVCEQFTDAPSEIADEMGRATWHFIIDGTKVTVDAGKIARADQFIRADYQQTLPLARMVYTEEMIAEAREREEAGDAPVIPGYLSELHNRLAVRTA